MSAISVLKNMARPFYNFVRKTYRLSLRSFVRNSFDEKNYKSIPIIINNFNRLGYLEELIASLEQRGYTNIFILDNCSTYPPLVAFYRSTPHTIIRLARNTGYMALWKTDVFKKFRRGYYVYTDADVVPVEDCPPDFLLHLLNLLKKYPQVEKIGLGLKIDDLPDQYALKQEVIDWELQFWKKEVEKGVFDAPVDTTFALYKPYAKGNAEQCPAFRTGGKYLARHLPWYENSARPTEEAIFYKEHIKPGTSFWSQK
jgi:hypothetical protein